MSQQTDFLGLLPPAQNIIPVVVEHLGKDYYCATIANGWWSASATTPKGAVKKVVELYENEMGKYDCQTLT